VHLGELTGWTSVALGQLVSWPQVMKLRRERGEGVSLASYVIVLVSMSLFLVHAVSIGDLVSTVSVPLSLIPNVLIAATLLRRRGDAIRAASLAVGRGGEGVTEFVDAGRRQRSDAAHEHGSREHGGGIERGDTLGRQALFGA
jgi:uncharacterized protein with PQ loop repeat